jgi:hypothetical protein
LPFLRESEFWNFLFKKNIAQPDRPGTPLPEAPVVESLSEGSTENSVYVPLGRFGTTETELLVLHTVFRCDRTFWAIAAVINRDTHETPAGCTKDQFFALISTTGVGRAVRA